VARKTRLVFYPKTYFQPIFYPEHPRNLLNQYMAFKKAKKKPKTQNQPEIKNLSKFRSVFLSVLRLKKDT